MAILGLSVLALAASGCVRRTLVVNSEPPGATVFLDGTNRGTTPLEMPFTWYGTREMLLHKRSPTLEEMEQDPSLDPHTYRLHTTFEIKRPGYQQPGADIASDLLYPGTIEDRQQFDFVLEQVPLLEDEAGDAADLELLGRADEFRTHALDHGEGDEDSGVHAEHAAEPGAAPAQQSGGPRAHSTQGSRP